MERYLPDYDNVIFNGLNSCWDQYYLVIIVLRHHTFSAFGTIDLAIWCLVNIISCHIFFPEMLVDRTISKGFFDSWNILLMYSGSALNYVCWSFPIILCWILCYCIHPSYSLLSIYEFIWALGIRGISWHVTTCGTGCNIFWVLYWHSLFYAFLFFFVFIEAHILQNGCKCFSNLS